MCLGCVYHLFLGLKMSKNLNIYVKLFKHDLPLLAQLADLAELDLAELCTDVQGSEPTTAETSGAMQLLQPFS